MVIGMILNEEEKFDEKRTVLTLKISPLGYSKHRVFKKAAYILL